MRATWGGCNRTVHTGTLCGGNWCAVGFSEANAYGLAIGHADVTTKTIQDVLLGTNSIRLINEIDEATLLYED